MYDRLLNFELEKESVSPWQTSKGNDEGRTEIASPVRDALSAIHACHPLKSFIHRTLTHPRVIPTDRLTAICVRHRLVARQLAFLCRNASLTPLYLLDGPVYPYARISCRKGALVKSRRMRDPPPPPLATTSFRADRVRSQT